MVPALVSRFCRTKSPCVADKVLLLFTTNGPLATCTCRVPLEAVIPLRVSPPELVVTLKPPPALPAMRPGWLEAPVILACETLTLALVLAAVKVNPLLAVNVPVPLTETPEPFVMDIEPVVVMTPLFASEGLCTVMVELPPMVVPLPIDT